MSVDLAARKQALLAMTGQVREPAWDGLDAADWQQIDAMAQQHRLQPWLHHRLRGQPGWTVPEAIAEGWQAAYRDGALTALTAQAALVRLAAAFAEADVAMVALKGAQLAFFAYPEPALRPMRDLDILVAQDDLPAALEAMALAGCAVPEDRAAAIARALDGDKHLDAIALPACQRFIELHHRIAEPGLPTIPTAAILAAASNKTLGTTEVPFPSPEHMLGHLVLHAAYNHRFDCGPLALVDIAMLCRAERIDAAAFRSLAERGGWLPGAQLVLALVERHIGPTGLEIGQDGVPRAVVDGADTLVLQDFDQRDQVKLASESAQATWAAVLLRRLRQGLAAPHEEGRWHWLASRAARTLRQGRDPRARAEAAAGAALARWLYRS